MNSAFTFVGNYQSCFSIDDDYNIWSHGKNLVQCDDNKDNIPKIIPFLFNIKMISCGREFACCCNFEGEVFSFGKNNYGQLGLGDTEVHLEPKQITNIPPISYLTCGFNFCICLSMEGLLYSFGSNSNSNLGLGNSNMVSSPSLIPNLTNVELVESGCNFTICKTKNGKIYSWGNGSEGQLGVGDTETHEIPTLCSDTPNDIVSIKCGVSHFMALTSNGKIYACGSNKYGQLTIEFGSSVVIPSLIYGLPLIQKISCGYQHSMCIDDDNNLWVFGDNLFGQLGLGDKKERKKPVKHPIGKIIDISYGGYTTYFKKDNYDIFAVGRNDKNQIFGQTAANLLTPVKVLKEDIWYTGYGRSKQKSARK